MYMDISKKYNVIYADPPWSFKTFSDKGKDRSPENHYNVMTLQDIKELPVNQIANDNSVGQVVLSGKVEDLDKLILILKEKSIKNIN